MKNITVIIVTFHTPENIILDCLNSIDKSVKVVIIENSNKFLYQDSIQSRFNNVRILCSGKNLGYGAGNNLGLKQVNTDYALILNPDTVCEEKFFDKISNVIEDANNFSIIGCQYLKDPIFMPAGFFDKKKNNEFVENFKNNKIEELAKVDWVTGQSMIINLNKFKDKNIFDEKFFLYFEEFDLCKSIIRTGGKIYTTNKLKIHHLGFKSSLNEDEIENLKTMNIKDWHYMWSSFYFYKKNYNFFYALFKLSGKLLKSLIKMIYFSITFQKNNKNKYLYRFLGLFNSMIGNPSNYRGK